MTFAGHYLLNTDEGKKRFEKKARAAVGPWDQTADTADTGASSKKQLGDQRAALSH